MKGQLDRTKVVLRHLPPAITRLMLTEQIDASFSGRYNWLSFLPGKTSQNRQSCSRAYIDFKRPEDVLEFAEFFNGHVFVNEKGAQFKTIVEYAPSQHVPKKWSKKDGREGTIFQDPEYVEFLEVIAKPVENLPSAEIQLERREAERTAAVKDNPIVTPLMDFVRQKRAAKAGPRRLLFNGKLSRRAGGSTRGTPGSASSKRGSDKKTPSTTMYVLRDSAKNTSGKDKSTYILIPKRDDQQIVDKPVASVSATGSEVLEEESVSGVSGYTDAGKKKVLLLKGKEPEISHVSSNMSQHQNAAPVKHLLGSQALKNQRREGSGRIIRGILLNRDARHSHFSGVQSEQQGQNSNLEKDKRPPRPPQVQLVLKDTNGVSDDKFGANELHSSCSEKLERRTRNKDRPDRGVWTLRRSDGSYASDESLSSKSSQPSPSAVDSSEGSLGDVKVDMSDVRSGDVKMVGSGRSSHSSFDNGSYRHGVRRGPTNGVKDADGTFVISEGKPLRRGGASGYGSHEVITHSLDISFVPSFFNKM
ncbi:hypothetical protein Ddye_000862 [Dipteronia dyeriana]|uniref:UPF3 domain-containing protein n=1 Tax=Dipteronia dyeriana TaxID=168575 RepID=A0AAD9XNU2_9ROSI|nr:hypothetical protein Ddye_000862 [Dipteronia dyeriana]